MKLLLPTCLGLAAVANAWTGDNCKKFSEIYTGGEDLIDHATVQAQRDPSSRASSLCVRGPYYEYNVRGYAVLPVVDIRSRASLSCR